MCKHGLGAGVGGDTLKRKTGALLRESVKTNTKAAALRRQEARSRGRVARTAVLFCLAECGKSMKGVRITGDRRRGQSLVPRSFLTKLR